MSRFAALALAAALTVATPAVLHAQNAVGGPLDPFRDTSMLKLPAGQRAAIFEWEDLECPACAHAFPVTHAAIERYHIPLYRHDFLIPGHAWSPTAAITARYLQDKVSPETAEQFRRDVFANQSAISGLDDLDAFTRRWFSAHKLQEPFQMDPTGRFAAEIESDVTLANRLGLRQTPTIIVLAPHGWTEVKDVSNLYSVIDAALAETPAKPAVHKAH